MLIYQELRLGSHVSDVLLEDFCTVQQKSRRTNFEMRKLGSYRNSFHQAFHGDGHNLHLLLHLLLQLINIVLLSQIHYSKQLFDSHLAAINIHVIKILQHPLESLNCHCRPLHGNNIPGLPHRPVEHGLKHRAERSKNQPVGLNLLLSSLLLVSDFTKFNCPNIVYPSSLLLFFSSLLSSIV